MAKLALPGSLAKKPTVVGWDLRQGLAALGPKVVGGLRFVCSDMWRPYLTVLAAHASQAVQVLARFHITMHLIALYHTSGRLPEPDASTHKFC